VVRWSICSAGAGQGADLERFAGQWLTSEQGLHRATAAIEAYARDLSRQAQGQESTSQESSVPARASLPTGAGVDPKTVGTCPTIDVPSCDELTQEELDRIVREMHVDTDAEIVLETSDGKINAAEAAVMAWFFSTGGKDKVESMIDIKREADGAREEAYPDQGLDQQEDAFRHAYWNARMTQEHGDVTPGCCPMRTRCMWTPRPWTTSLRRWTCITTRWVDASPRSTPTPALRS